MQQAMSQAGERKVWFTVSELAEMDLPGLSHVPRLVNRIATTQRWAEKFNGAGEAMARKRAGRGGGLEYNIELLPPSARLELQRRAGDAPVVELAAPEGGSWAWFDAQSEKIKTEARSRLSALQAVEEMRRSGLGYNAAVATVAGARDVSNATIWNWFALVKCVVAADWLPALAPRRKGGGVKAQYDERIYQTFKSYFLTPMPRTYKGSYFYTKRCPELKGLAFPGVKTLQRRLEREVPREVIILKRQGMKALMERVPSQTRTVADLHAMALVNIDGHKIDVFVIPPDGGKPIRAMLIAMQDVYSRKMLAWRLCGEESIFHTRLCFADLFKKWGLPDAVLMDNGRAFASKYLTGGTKTRFRYVVKETDPWGLLPALGIKNHFATPEHGQAKPVERGFGDLVKFIAHHPACAGAYTGNRPDRKPHDYGSKAISWDQLSLIVDEMIPEYNALMGRETEMANGRSFDDVFTESMNAQVRPQATPQQLRMALLEAKTDHRADSKTGEIRMLGNRYHSPDLYSQAGKQVTVRFDPDNLHSPVYVYSATGQFICEAPVIQATGFLDTEAAKLIAKKRADMRRMARQLTDAEELLAASQLKAMQPQATQDEDAPAPRPKAVRLVRSRGHSAAAAVIVDGAPRVDQAAPITLFTAAVERMSRPSVRPQFSIFDGGLSNPNPEPERPK